MNPSPPDASHSPDRPRRRVTLKRLMALVAIAAICIAWMPASIAPVVILPVLSAAFLPGGATWAAVEVAAAAGWLAGAAVAFSEQFVDAGDLAQFGLSGLLIGGSWYSRAGRALTPERGGVGRPCRWPFVTPAVGLIGLILLFTQRDFHLRFLASERVLRAVAMRTPADFRETYPGRGRRLGLLRFIRVEADRGGVVYLESGGGMVDDGGLAYIPVGPPPGLPYATFRHLRGPWWEYRIP